MSIFSRESFARYWANNAENALVAIIKIAVIIIAYLVVRYLLSRLARTLLSSKLARLSGDILQARQARLRALQSVLMSAISFVLGLVAILMIFQSVGINAVPILTTASVAGLAIGFGAQKLVRDVITGFFILMEDQYGVGDYVTIGGVTGVVDSLEMRTTRIRDASGKLHILSNGDISQVCNHSRGTLTMSVEYALAPSSDIDAVCSAINEVGASLAKDFPKDVVGAFKCEGMVQMTAASTAIRVTGAVSPPAQDRVRLELNRRIRNAFEARGISLA